VRNFDTGGDRWSGQTSAKARPPTAFLRTSSALTDGHEGLAGRRAGATAGILRCGWRGLHGGAILSMADAEAYHADWPGGTWPMGETITRRITFHRHARRRRPALGRSGVCDELGASRAPTDALGSGVSWSVVTSTSSSSTSWTAAPTRTAAKVADRRGPRRGRPPSGRTPLGDIGRRGPGARARSRSPGSSKLVMEVVGTSTPTASTRGVTSLGRRVGSVRLRAMTATRHPGWRLRLGGETCHAWPTDFWRRRRPGETRRPSCPQQDGYIHAPSLQQGGPRRRVTPVRCADPPRETIL